MERGKIAVIVKDLEEPIRDRIRETAAECGYEAAFYESHEEAIPHLSDTQIIYGSGTDLIAAAPDLRWFHASSAGVDAYMKPGVFQNEDCILTNSSGAYGVTVSEHGLMLTLMLLRRYPEYDRIVRRREWTNDLPIRSVYGSRVTVLGTGDIGSRYAARVRAFEPALITGVNRSGRIGEEKKALYDRILTQDRLEEVLPHTDILFMALPGTGSTFRMLNKERLSLLPSHAIVINVGRGTAIDQKALLQALQEGVIAGAGLDVFEKEPLPEDDPAWNTPGLLITPHSGGQMTLAVTRQKNAEAFCEDLVRYSRGEKPVHLVDRTIGY